MLLKQPSRSDATLYNIVTSPYLARMFMLVTTLRTMQMWCFLAAGGTLHPAPCAGESGLDGSWASLPLQRPAQEEELSHVIDV